MKEADTLHSFRRDMQMRNFGAQTVAVYCLHARRYLKSLDASGGEQQPSWQNVEAFRHAVKHLMPASRRQIDCALRSYFRFLVERGDLLSNPMEGVRSPKVVLRAQRPTLTPGEARRMLAVPDTRDPIGARNRAVLEMLYGTAMRRSELLALNIYDLDLKDGLVWIRHGKGRKDRRVPLGTVAAGWTYYYLAFGRPKLKKYQTGTALLLSRTGHPLRQAELARLIRTCARQAGIKKKVTPHTFRHTAATEMVRNGAELRYVQEFLGHRHLATTQIYTRVTNPDLRQMIDNCHPASRRGLKPIRWRAALRAQ